jgi:regulator of sigma E protease
VDLIGLIPQFGNLLYTIAAFVVALSVIVAVHEYGHYIVGRWCGIHAEVFSLGFGPVLASRVDRRGTRWQIAALPFGGYVKFLGDASAVSDKADAETFGKLSDADRRRTMHGAPLWARAATVAAGPAFNFILSLIVFGAVILWRGVAAEPLTIASVADLPAEVQELRAGDAVVGLADRPVGTLEELYAAAEALPPAASLDWTVVRDGQELVVHAPWPTPPLVGGVNPDSAAADAGVQEGDAILAVDGQPVGSFNMLRDVVGQSDGQPLTLTVWRAGQTLDLQMTPRRVDLPLEDGGFETRWLIGVTGGLLFEPVSVTPGIGTAVTMAGEQIAMIVRSSISGLYHMAVGAISTCNMSGPIGIAETSGSAAAQGWMAFIWFIAVLSTAVGLLNLFPIPILDGGHLVFHAWEAVTGKPPSERALNVLMTVGLALIGTLMVFALGNDILCP